MDVYALQSKNGYYFNFAKGLAWAWQEAFTRDCLTTDYMEVSIQAENFAFCKILKFTLEE